MPPPPPPQGLLLGCLRINPGTHLCTELAASTSQPCKLQHFTCMIAIWAGGVAIHTPHAHIPGVPSHKPASNHDQIISMHANCAARCTFQPTQGLLPCQGTQHTKSPCCDDSAHFACRRMACCVYDKHTRHTCVACPPCHLPAQQEQAMALATATAWAQQTYMNQAAAPR
jgi:hypothetical protein